MTSKTIQDRLLEIQMELDMLVQESDILIAKHAIGVRYVDGQAPKNVVSFPISRRLH